MPRLIFFGLLLFSLPAMANSLRFAGRPKKACGEVFGEFNMKFDFEPDIELNPTAYKVRWQGQEFRLPRGQFTLLEFVLTAESDLITWQDVIDYYYGEDPNVDVEASLKVQLSYIRRAFRTVDPQFNRLKVQNNQGLFWQKQGRFEKIQLGRLAVAKHLPIVWWDQQQFKLRPGQHTVLLHLAARKEAGAKADSLPRLMKSKSFQVYVCTLNQLFEPLIQGRLIVNYRDPYHEVYSRLNSELLEQLPQQGPPVAELLQLH